MDNIDYVEVNRLLGLMEQSVERIKALCSKNKSGLSEENWDV